MKYSKVIIITALEYLIKLADYYETTIDYIAGRTAEEKPPSAVAAPVEVKKREIPKKPERCYWDMY